jgi:hypothetical protein
MAPLEYIPGIILGGMPGRCETLNLMGSGYKSLYLGWEKTFETLGTPEN